MGEMADYALDMLDDCDEYQMRTIGRSTVFSGGRRPRGTMTPPPCSSCGGLMVKRDGPYGPFWGCGSFPKCRGKTYAAQEPSMAGQSAFTPEEELAMELDEAFD
jgi:hypothetical protein